jgi:glycerol kinase
MGSNDGYILALDQGTTSSRAILFNKAGNVVGSAQKPFRQIYPKPGWVEHDPEEIWASQLEVARGALESAQVTPDQVRGISNQRETAILWDRKTGKPVYNAIVWQCRRSSEICEELKALGYEKPIREKTGLRLDPYFSGSKLIWLFRELPGLKERAERGEIMFGTVDSWLIYRLTGKHLTDATNASRTLLYNLRDKAWDGEILRMFGIPESILPRVMASSDDYGLTKKELFGREIPICGCAGDQQAALFGHACFEPGSVKNTYGTGCFALMNMGRDPVISKQGLLTTIAWDLGKDGVTYAMEGSVFIGGAVIQWLRDELGLLKDAAESEKLARSIQDSGEVFLVPAFVGLGAPYWDPEARGTIVGITRGTTRAHIARAALESIAYQSYDLIEAMEAECRCDIPSLKADGGASANSFLMQFQADILGKPVRVPEVNEVTALGAAYLAGLRIGYWSGLREVELNWRMRREFTSGMADSERVALIGRWRKAVEAARGFK